jgi:repressor LexA
MLTIPDARGRPLLQLVAPGLTDRQAEVLVFITQYQLQQGRPPSMRDIMERFGHACLSGCVCHLKALRRKGWLEDGDRTKRGYRPTRSLRLLRPLEWREIA